MLGIDKRAARYAWTTALVFLLMCLVYLMRRTLFLFIVALLFAYLLAPLVNVIDRLIPADRTRNWALALAYLIFLGVLFVGVTQIGSRVIDQANALAKSMPALLNKLEQPEAVLPSDTNSLKAQVLREVRDHVAKSSGSLFAYLPNLGAKILSAASNLVYVVIVPILGFFFLKDGREFPRHFLDLIDDEHQRALVDDLLADVNLLLAHYMRALFTLCLATFTSYSIFFSILRVPYSILLAAVAATLEIVPMIGPLAAGVLILIVTAVSGGPFLGSLIFLLVFRVFQDYVLSPQLMHSGVQLHPLLVLFGVFAGAEIAGIPGAFLSVPVLALIRVVYRRFRRQHLSVDVTAPATARLP
ncbi:MAG TPA: AI-2E family transporter [Bryobacteraceae bacterium]|nr:AI-2E family transporter [Bryobacteraceae bacterium]